MSIMRATEKGKYTDCGDGHYVFLADGGRLEHYGSLEDVEVFCEIMLRVLDQAGVEIDDKDVEKVKERLMIDE